MGVTYVVVAPESEMCSILTTEAQRDEVEKYRVDTSKASEIERQSTTREKTGVFTGSYAIHPLNGRKVPIWASDYVIAGYGTGIVMAVPAHDERDYEFASKFGMDIVRVVASSENAEDELPYCEKNGVLINSDEFNGLNVKEAIDAIVGKLSKMDMGEKKINYRLRDWLISRQRYWGTPIPMIHCQKCGVVPVPEDQLPVLLPYDVEFKPDGESPLAKCDSFINCTCPNCKGPAKRDPDTMDTFMDSSWYEFRYADNKNDKAIFDKEIINKICPVDKYVGGSEHAAMHLLYARFICKAMRDMGLVNFDEPFTSLVHQGIILGPDGNRMSKSRGNTISPDDYVNKFGSDVFRTYLAFGFAYTEGGPWSDTGLQAIVKFTNRIEKLVNDIVEAGSEVTGDISSVNFAKEEKDLNYVINYAIKNVSIDSNRFQFNTSIARMMELINAINKYQLVPNADMNLIKYAAKNLVLLYAPFAPHFTEELWEKLGEDYSIFNQAWPTHDENALVLDTVEIAVQVNGKIIFKLDVATDASSEEVKGIIMEDAEFIEALAGRSIAKFIYVQGRLANIVVK